MNDMPQQQIDPNAQVSVIMAAAEWQAVLHALDEAPMPKRISAPLAARIYGEVTAGARTPPRVVPQFEPEHEGEAEPIRRRRDSA